MDMIREILMRFWVWLTGFFASKSFFAFKKKSREMLRLPPPRLPGEEPSKQSEQHASSAYMQLKMIFRDIGRMGAIIEALGRDFLTAMPQGAYKSRLGQIAFLHGKMHEELAAEKTAKWIEEALEHEHKNPDTWDTWDHANLREMEIMYRHQCQVPAELMEQRARLAYDGRRIHREVMQNNDWETARPFLEDMLELQKKIGAAKQLRDNDGDQSVYQALMREYIPGMRVDEVDKLFNQLAPKLKDMLGWVLEEQEKRTAPEPLKGPFPVEQQMWLNKTLLHAIGFDFTRGGLYETGFNPVEGGTPDDTHLVIKAASINNFLISLKSTLHEGGHGLYVQGLPRDTWRYQPVALDLGNAVHESQALLIEMILGRRREFFDYLAPRVEGLFQKFGDPAMSAENLYKLKTWVKPTYDRKTADELTYFFHVKLRFDIERDLFSGKLKIKDVPEAWAAGLKESLGVEVKTPKEGPLQDVHWFVGKFGYFPAYVIGHMMAAQIHDRMKKDVQNIPGLLRSGNFLPVRDWLNDNIHKYGRLKRPAQLVEDVTGMPLNPSALIHHLEERYLPTGA